MAVPRMARSFRWALAGGAAGAALLPTGVSLADKKADASGALDPEIYERAAKAVREINSSPHAKQVRTPGGGGVWGVAATRRGLRTCFVPPPRTPRVCSGSCSPNHAPLARSWR